jgi:hypothetical protein
MITATAGDLNEVQFVSRDVEGSWKMTRDQAVAAGAG